MNGAKIFCLRCEKEISSANHECDFEAATGFSIVSAFKDSFSHRPLKPKSIWKFFVVLGILGILALLIGVLF